MVRIANLTSGTTLATEADTARNPWTRFTGLMGRAGLPAGSALIFPGEKGVHTHFMRFAIDVVFYDGDLVVIEAIESLRPWRFSPYRRHAHGLIELPAGSVRASGTRTGDRLAFT